MAAQYDLAQVISRLRKRCPDMLEEIEWVRARCDDSSQPLRYVEVTRPNGHVEVMTEAQYLHSSATELAHTNLRYLLPEQVQQNGG